MLRFAVWRSVSSSTKSPAPDAPNQQERMEQLQREKDALEIEVKILELKVEKLQRQLWGKKSERLAPEDEAQRVFFEEVTGLEPGRKAPASKASKGGHRERIAPGPKPLDPALPREVIQVPAPDLKKLICPATGGPMAPGFIERIEVLARRAPEFYVKVYERVVFVSPAKTAPVYSPWPAEVLPRSRVHVSIVAYVAAAHYCEHLPLYAAPGIKRPMPGGGLCRAA
jgi:hypothetical protein